ncbi:hypothetical protein PENSPDRAFT_646441 [Peniophora sp. CONT]|nr:hypothetical protein PENSPDRAFT_646441 [Peniophora sp. CONT]
MSSRADSTSPPPYSFESSSFPPPPPRVGEIARNWDFQAKFEAAEERVRIAVLETITAWKAPRPCDTWEFVPRVEIQDTYDAAPLDLKRALEFLVDCRYTTYLNNDLDRRTHEYFHRLGSIEHTGSSRWPAQSPAAFYQDFMAAHEPVQKSVLTTFGLWKYNRGGEYTKPAPDEVLQAYRTSPPELKVLLNWVLDIGSIVPVQDLRDVAQHEGTMRKYIEDSIRVKNQVQYPI